MLNTLIYHLKVWTAPLGVSAVGAGLYLLVAGVLLRYEWGVYAPTRRVRSWIVLHLFSPVFAWFAYYAASLPAAGVSGMEALGVFYMLIITASPLVYFTCHVILGRVILLPELSVRESLIIATTSIAIFGGAALTFGFVKGHITGAQRQAGRIDVRHAVSAENPFVQTQLLRFAMPDGETLVYASFMQNRFITRFQLNLFYGSRAPAGGVTAARNYVCRCGDELHLVFIEEKNGLLPTLQCYWRAEGKVSTFVSEIAPDLSRSLDRPFSVRKTGDTLELPVALPFSIVTPIRENGRWISSFSRDSSCELGGCLNRTFTPDADALSLQLRLERPGLKPSERHVFEFPLP